jgi:cob(I)alamin adenosyltransferase
MTTSTTTLRAAAAALHDAEAGLASGDCAATHEALRALARTSYRSLTAFEHETGAGALTTPLLDRLAWWREQLDEARLQVALAEMETRDTRDDLLDVVQRHLEPFSGAVATAVADMSSALAALRKELRELQDRLPEHATHA